MPGLYLVHTSHRLITRAWKNRLDRLPPKKDYHVYIHVYHLGLCVFSLGYSSAPEWLEPVLWPRTWLCELMWEQQQQRSIYHYAYARQTRVNFFFEKRNKEQIKRERKGKERKEKKAKKENEKRKRKKKKRQEKTRKARKGKTRRGSKKRKREKKCNTSRP